MLDERNIMAEFEHRLLPSVLEENIDAKPNRRNHQSLEPLYGQPKHLDARRILTSDVKSVLPNM